MLFSCSVFYRAIASQLLFRRFLSWTLAIRLRSKPHRLAVPQMPLGLLACLPAEVTRKKSLLASTTPCAPAPRHQRRSDASCRTMLPALRPSGSVPFAGGQVTQPRRTAPTARERSFGSPARTNASESQTPGADAPLEKWPPSANALQTR